VVAISVVELKISRICGGVHRLAGAEQSNQPPGLTASYNTGEGNTKVQKRQILEFYPMDYT
jgi:hypothetical protein